MNGEYINWLFYVLDFILAGVAVARGLMPLYQLSQNIQALLAELQSFAPEDYVHRFEDIHKVFVSDEHIRPSWEDYRKTLVHSTDDENQQHLYSVADASAFFRYSDFTKSIHVTYWQNFGAVFTGVGILGTFAGLVFGLWSLDLTSSDVAVLKDGIGGLLNGISTAFITSLIGIGLALLYGAAYHLFNSQLMDKIRELSALIDSRYPRQITEQWLSDSFRESKEQTKTLKNLSQDMAEDLGQILESQLSDGFAELCDNLNNQMKPAFDKLYEAISELNKGGSTAIADELSKQTGAQLSSFARVLTDMQDSLQQSVQASQQISRQAGELMQETMAGMRQALAEGTAEAVQKQQEASAQMNQQLQQLVAAMNDGSQQALHNYAAVSQSAQEQLTASLAGVQETTTSIIGNMQQMSTEQERHLQEMAQKQDARMQELFTKQENMLQTSTEAAEQRLSATVNLLHETIQKQNEVFSTSYEAIHNEAAGLEKLLRELNDAGGALAANMEPVEQATHSLHDELQQLRAESKQMHDKTQEQITAFTENNRQTEANLQTLLSAMHQATDQSESAWQQYQQNFAGVSGELERTTKLLTDQLAQYNEAMNSGLKSQLEAYDKSVANVVSSLGSIVDDLNDSINDLAKQGNKR